MENNVAGIACDPLIKAYCENNAKKGFEKNGIFLLSLDVMLKGIFSCKPVVQRDTLPHVTVVVGQKIPPPRLLEVSDRQKRVLRELDLNVDALNVVNLLSSFTAAPLPQKRKRGYWIDNRYVDGGLLDYDMLHAAEAKAAAIAEADRQKAERAAAKQAEKLEKLEKGKRKGDQAEARAWRAKKNAKVKAEKAKERVAKYA
ncbi:hypothetical protein PRIC1_002665 [Phytophthora ramorum]